MNNKKTGEFISTARKELGYSQKELAEKLNITDKSVSKWETGRSLPDVSMLLPLAEALGVSVTEILNGERISKEKINSASDEMIVKAMKKSKSKIMIAIILCLIFLIGLICSYPAYHYFSTIAEDDYSAITELTEKSFDVEDLKVITSVEKSNYVFFLLANDEKSYLMRFERSELFKNRIGDWGGTGISKDNPEILGVYAFGTSESETIVALFGANLEKDINEYSFIYNGTMHTRNIENDYVLDVFIYKDQTFHTPQLLQVGDKKIGATNQSVKEESKS